MNINTIWLKLISYLLMFICIMLIIPLKLFPCFIAGFLTYELIVAMISWFDSIIKGKLDKWVVVTLSSSFIIITTIFLIVVTVSFLTSDIQNNLEKIISKNRLFFDIKNCIPNYLTSFIPDNTKELKDHLFFLIKSNLIFVKNISRSFLHGIVTIFVGIITGTIIAFNKSSNCNTYFIQQLLERLHYFSQAFRKIVFAQIKISIINTLLTSSVILILLPLFHIYLPMNKTLIILTFIFGLLPIIGNVISNVIIIISSFSISISIGGLMILYLILVHKLEYFLNAEIIGNHINAKPWELLLVMLLFEAIFGIEGLIAAPIYYAYLKLELRKHALI